MVTKPPVILTRKDKRNNSVTQSLCFRTSAMPCLNYYHDLFYKDRVKSIPRNLEDLLTARGLAFWIMVLTLIYLIIYLSTILPCQNVEDLVVLNMSTFPVKFYLNADKEKESIYVDNRNKCGVYRWVNLSNQKSYVGSSLNLSKRFSFYYSLVAINNAKRLSLICKALLKYGYSGFKLEILEYCNESEVINREQYYIDYLNPEYNILKIAGSTLGYKHTEETLSKLKAREFTPESLIKLRDHLSKHNASEEQRTKAKERMLAINEKKGIRVEVTDVRSEITTVYASVWKAADALGTDNKALMYNEEVQIEKGGMKLFKKFYKVKILRN